MGEKKRKRAEVSAEQTDAAALAGASTTQDSLLSSKQVGSFLRARPKPTKPVGFVELRQYLKDTLQIKEVSKAKLKATLRQIVSARLEKQGKVAGGSKAAKAAPALPADFKRGDWICPACRNHNYASRADCNKCGTAEPPSAKGPAKKEKKEKVREEKWECPKCENRNFATRKKCNRCEEPKPAAAPPEPAAPPEEAPTPQTGKKGVWDTELLLTREEIEEYVSTRDHSSGPLTGEELRNYMVWDLKKDEPNLKKTLFANTIKAAVEVNRRRYKRLKREKRDAA